MQAMEKKQAMEKMVHTRLSRDLYMRQMRQRLNYEGKNVVIFGACPLREARIFKYDLVFSSEHELRQYRNGARSADSIEIYIDRDTDRPGDLLCFEAVVVNEDELEIKKRLVFPVLRPVLGFEEEISLSVGNGTRPPDRKDRGIYWNIAPQRNDPAVVLNTKQSVTLALQFNDRCSIIVSTDYLGQTEKQWEQDFLLHCIRTAKPPFYLSSMPILILYPSKTFEAKKVGECCYIYGIPPQFGFCLALSGKTMLDPEDAQQ